MPIINGVQPHTGPGPMSPDSLRQSLQLQGPMLGIQVSIPDAMAQALREKGEAVPAPIIGNALIDTGASNTCIDDAVMQQLGVPATNSVKLGSAAGHNEHNVYMAKITFAGIPGVELNYSVVGVNLKDQFSPNVPLIGLLGRDLLSNCVLIYNGTLGMFTLSVG